MIIPSDSAETSLSSSSSLSGNKYNNKNNEKITTTIMTKKKLPRVAKYKKAPQAPLRFKSSYMFFSIQKHKEIRNEMDKKGESKDKVCTTTVAKMVSQAWKDLSNDEREVFEEMARKDKERYEREKSRYMGPWKVLDEKLPKKKDPGAPKKPMSAFLAFSNSKRSEVKKEHGGDIDNAKLSRILAQMWKDASEEEKKIYTDKEFELRREYKIAMEQWKKENEESERNDESCATGEQNNPKKESIAHSEYYHGYGYSRDAPYYTSSSMAGEKGMPPYESGYYPYYHYQNGHLHQMHPGTYPSAPPSYGDTSQYHNHPHPPPPQQQQSSKMAGDGNVASGPGPYYSHPYGGSLPAPTNGDTNYYHHYHHSHQHQTPHSNYHQQAPPTCADPVPAAPHGYNQPDANPNYHSTGAYSHGKTDNYTSSGTSYGDDSYQQYPSTPEHHQHYYNHHQQQCQNNGHGTDGYKHNHANATQNYDYYGGNNNNSYHQYQGHGGAPAQDSRQQQDGDAYHHRYRFGGGHPTSSNAEGEEYYGYAGNFN